MQSQTIRETGAAAKIGFILTSRPANDFWVCSLSAQLGYGIQALLVGATIVELVGAVAYVGDSESRAANWAEHSDLKHTTSKGRRRYRSIAKLSTYL
jgi:hypothetical protein